MLWSEPSPSLEIFFVLLELKIYYFLILKFSLLGWHWNLKLFFFLKFPFQGYLKNLSFILLFNFNFQDCLWYLKLFFICSFLLPSCLWIFKNTFFWVLFEELSVPKLRISFYFQFLFTWFSLLKFIISLSLQILNSMLLVVNFIFLSPEILVSRLFSSLNSLFNLESCLLVFQFKCKIYFCIETLVPKVLVLSFKILLHLETFQRSTAKLVVIFQLLVSSFPM